MKEREGILWWISVAGLLGMMVEFGYSAVLPLVAGEWNLSGLKAGLLFSAFKVGYVASILFVGALIDVVSARKVMTICSIAVGIAGSVFALFARDFLSGFILRGLAGIGAAGIYIPGMKILSDWFPQSSRGRALGLYVGVAAVIGPGISVALSGLVSSLMGWRMGVLATSIGAFISAGIIYLLVREKGGYHTRSPTSMPRPNLLKERPLMLAVTGYAGHNWELIGMWNWIAPFMIAAAATAGLSGSLGTTLAATIICIGGLSSFLGGHISDRIGRTTTTIIMLAVSGMISLGFGWLQFGPLPLIAAIGLIYGFSAVGDSPVFSTQVTEFAPDGNIGAALGLSRAG